MAQQERIKDLKVGDWMQLPDGEWHLNRAAKAVYDMAQAYATKAKGEVKPQFQVESYSDGVAFKHKLERIR